MGEASLLKDGAGDERGGGGIIHQAKINLLKNGNWEASERQHESHFTSKAASKLKVKKLDFEGIFPKPFHFHSLNLNTQS